MKIPKAEEVEKNKKLKTIFNFSTNSIDMIEAQLLNTNEMMIKYKNLSYLNFRDFKFVFDNKFKMIGNKKTL